MVLRIDQSPAVAVATTSVCTPMTATTTQSLSSAWWPQHGHMTAPSERGGPIRTGPAALLVYRFGRMNSTTNAVTAMAITRLTKAMLTP
jgi:hypothetical protein